MLTICYTNECPEIVDHATAQKWVAAVQHQVLYHLADKWNIGSRLHYIGDSQIEKPGPKDAIIKLVKYSSVDGALGAHWAEGARPVGEVGVQTAIDDGVEPTEVLCHETDELTIDPPGCECVQQGHLLLIKEVNDRVSHSDPTYKINGFAMENFSLPSAFTDGEGPWDFREICKHNEVLPTGYQQQIDLGSAEWQQITGKLARASKRAAAPGSRLAKRMLRAGVAPAMLKILEAA